jgi:hypothetical protein
MSFLNPGFSSRQLVELGHFFQSIKVTLMTNQSELAASLQALADQADKAKAEIIAEIANAEAKVAAAGAVSPEVDAAFARLKGAVQGLDDLNPDAPAPTAAPDAAPATPEAPAA